MEAGAIEVPVRVTADMSQVRGALHAMQEKVLAPPLSVDELEALLDLVDDVPVTHQGRDLRHVEGSVLATARVKLERSARLLASAQRGVG